MSDTSKKPLKILIADDDPTILRLLSYFLTQEGYQVVQAADGIEALTVVRAAHPDILITDWEMPGLRGPELCRQVRSLMLPHYVYIFFVTAKSSQEELLQGLESGADNFLSKPVSREELLARLKAAQRVLDLHKRLSDLALTDPLTGLMSRRALLGALSQQWQQSTRSGKPLCCVMVDVDFFKRINDLHGHAVGDIVLCAVAQILRESTRESDLLGRIGGEEFCVVLPDTTSLGGTVWAERKRRRIASARIPVGSQMLQLTASFGVAERHPDTQTADQLLDQADQALLCAKQTGRNRVARFEALVETPGGSAGPAGREDLFAGVLARDVMTPIVVTLSEGDTIGKVAEWFTQLRINSAPVVDASGKLVGIVSEKDIMAEMTSLAAWQRPVRAVMRRQVISYPAEVPVRQIYEFLCRVALRRVVIVERNEPVGTISRSTLLRWFRNLALSRGLVGGSDLSPEKPDPEGAGSPSENKDEKKSVDFARKLCEQLDQLAAQLQKHLQSNPDELATCLVGTATAGQSLFNDMLAYSQWLRGGGESTGAISPTFIASGHTD